MKTAVFQSFLAAFLSQFVQYKRALNRKYHTNAEILRLFDRYLHNRHIANWEAIDATLIDDFLMSRPRVSPRRYNQLLGVLRRFFDFAIMQEWIRCTPVKARPRRITGTRIPYLFDLNTAKRLLAVAKAAKRVNAA
jgi:site-specific recombinase XerD